MRSGNLTTTQAGELAFAVGSTADAETWTPGSGFALRQNVASKLVTEDKALSTAQTLAGTLSLTASYPWAALLATFKAADAHYSYVYDRFGNRWQQNGPNSMQLAFTGNNPGSPANNNRMDGYAYDAAGNLLNDGAHQYFYDAENKLIQVDGASGYCSSGTGTAATACYFYDANGNRVRNTAVPDCNGYSGLAGGMGYIYNLSGRWLTAVATNTPNVGSICQYDLYAGGRAVAHSSGQTEYSHVDWLGTERVRLSSGSPCETTTSLPFGDGQVITGQCYHASNIHFTGKERDSESGLDNFGARYNASSFGRFMSPDWSENPSPVPYASLRYPQSLNLYSYVQNNPLKSTDPNGHCTVDGEKHNWLWCAAHSVGITETKKETVAREKAEAETREFLRKHPEYIQNAILMAVSLGTAMAIEAGGMGSGEDGNSTVTPEESTAIEAGAATGAEAGVARTMANGVPQPVPEGEIVVAPNGTAVKIPAGYVAEPAANGNGIVYRPAGSTGNANIIRISGPDKMNPTGSVRIYNSQGQPVIPSTGKPGTNAQTHSPL